MEVKTLLLTDDRQDEILHANQSQQDLQLIIQYILVDYKNSNMTDNVQLINEQGQKLTIDDSLKTTNVFVFMPGQKNSREVDMVREVRYIYAHKAENQISIQKYRNKRKTEEQFLSREQLQLVIDQFKTTVGAFLSSNMNIERKFEAPLLPPQEVSKRQKVPVKGGQIAFANLPRPQRNLKNYTKDEVAKHDKQNDAWTVYNGKVYDITTYMDYHPGGKEMLMLAAGKDCTKLFNQFHAWVNGHAFLEKDFLGNLKG